jgi:hypothetical protein
MYYRIFNEVDEHYYPYAYNETDFEKIKDCVEYMLTEMMNIGDVEEDDVNQSIEELNSSNENNFPFHPNKTVCEAYSIEKSDIEFILNDIPEHMLQYVGEPWR